MVLVIGKVKLECKVMILRWAMITAGGGLEMMPVTEVREEYFLTTSLTETASFQTDANLIPHPGGLQFDDV